MKGRASSTPDYSILEAIQPVESPPRTSVLYQVNLLLVAIAMVVLPLIYVGLVGLAAYGVYYHAVEHVTWISGAGARSGRFVLGAVIFYVIPMFVGAVVVFFMIKPLFAGRPQRAQPLALSPTDNPLLYAFIEKICERVGAPSPRRIDLNCELNASAVFRRGFLSMFGNDLVLTLGLPLVANLNAAELAGVIAHEFGHFTQSLGMRLSYIIRSVNLWFLRVVYERDAWDENLEDWAAEVEDGRVAIILWAAQLGVFFARLILRILMFIGLLLGGFMLRQMEYDADAWEIKLAGSATFERTQRKLATLSAATEQMYKNIHAHWQQTQQLPDNLSELLRQAHAALPPAVLQKIEDAAGLERTGLFDSHPSLADRIRQARRADEPGVFHDDRPSTSLFSSFEHPARFVTLLHYTDDLDIPVTEPMLRRVESISVSSPSHAVSASVTDVPGQVDVLGRYFLGIAPVLLPINMPAVPGHPDYAAAMTELLQITASLHEVQEQLEPLGVRYAAATQKIIHAQAAQRLIDAGVTIDAVAFELSAATPEAAVAAEAEARAAHEAIRHSVHEVRAALDRRLQLGLGLALAGHEGGQPARSPAEINADMKKCAEMGLDFSGKQKLAEAISVFQRMMALRSPKKPEATLERALGAQLEAINRLQKPPEATPAVAAPVAALKINRVKPVDAATVTSLQRNTRYWLNDYLACLNRLVEAAESIEGIST